MDDVESLTHTLWECKYHIVWIPKYREKVMFCKLREHMGTLLKDLAMQKGCKILGGHLRPDHVHMLIREYIKTQEKEDQRIDQLNLIE